MLPMILKDAQNTNAVSTERKDEIRQIDALEKLQDTEDSTNAVPQMTIFLVD
jgi:hypothetical protein